MEHNNLNEKERGLHETTDGLDNENKLNQNLVNMLDNNKEKNSDVINIIKEISLICYPTILSYFCVYVQQTISLAFIGHKYNDGDYA